jgi:RTA1 like protein
VHTYQAFRHRKAFCWVIIMGALWETCAFAFRILSARNPTHKGSYDASFLLILLAPLSINAFDYMVLGRLTQAFLPENKIFGIKGSWMGKMFVCCDVLSVALSSLRNTY